MQVLWSTIVIGAGATAVMDLWGMLRKQLFGMPAADYGLVGRWLAGFSRGQFRHDSIAKSPAVRGERVIGWCAHYLIGMIFAGVLVAMLGVAWLRTPTIVPAVSLGIGTVAAPFLVMQPGMGAGIAASRTPNPTAARLQSLITHVVFGLGLYVTAWLISWRG